MPKFNAKKILPLLALALCACATQVPQPSNPVQVAPPKLPPAPADVMMDQVADFRESLLNFFLPKPTAPTPSSDSSPPAKQ